jgi:hypothetical protein
MTRGTANDRVIERTAEDTVDVQELIAPLSGRQSRRQIDGHRVVGNHVGNERSSGTTVDVIVAAKRDEQLWPCGSPFQAVTVWGAGDRIETMEAVPSATRRYTAPEIHADTFTFELVTEDVESVAAAIQSIAARPRLNDVETRSTQSNIATPPPTYRVASGTAADPVGSCSPTDDIVTATTLDDVVAAESDNDVRPWGSRDAIGAVGSDDGGRIFPTVVPSTS